MLCNLIVYRCSKCLSSSICLWSSSILHFWSLFLIFVSTHIQVLWHCLSKNTYVNRPVAMIFKCLFEKKSWKTFLLGGLKRQTDSTHSLSCEKTLAFFRAWDRQMTLAGLFFLRIIIWNIKHILCRCTPMNQRRDAAWAQLPTYAPRTGIGSTNTR